MLKRKGLTQCCPGTSPGTRLGNILVYYYYYYFINLFLDICRSRKIEIGFVKADSYL